MKIKVSFFLASNYVGKAESGILVGDFNQWDQKKGIKLKKLKDGSMVANATLDASTVYQYRYLLDDGRWVNDDNEKNIVNAYGMLVENCIMKTPDGPLLSKKKSLPAKKMPIQSLSSSNEKSLEQILGITKKIAGILKAEGIITLKDLSGCSMKKLLLILEDASLKNKPDFYTSWTKQAKLILAQKFEELNELQKKLKK